LGCLATREVFSFEVAFGFLIDFVLADGVRISGDFERTVIVKSCQYRRIISHSLHSAKLSFVVVCETKADDEQEIGDGQSTGKEERRLQAVLALLKGEVVTCVCQRFNICWSDLFKLRRRATGSSSLES